MLGGFAFDTDKRMRLGIYVNRAVDVRSERSSCATRPDINNREYIFAERKTDI
jgi:hypothetical protein